jgi:hypothetical protein
MNISLKKSTIIATFITILISTYNVQAHEKKSDGQMAEDKSGMTMMNDMKGMMATCSKMMQNHVDDKKPNNMNKTPEQ